MQTIHAVQSLEEQANVFLAAAELSLGADIAPAAECRAATGLLACPDGGTVDIWEAAADIYGTGGEEGELAWQAEALCAQTDPEAFFPEKGGSTRDAKRVCGVCPVRKECLKYAMDNDERFGIWGGLSERERRRLRKQAS